MAQLLTLNLLGSPSSTRPDSIRLQPLTSALYRSCSSRSFTNLSQNPKHNNKFTCRSSREEQARKALETALGGRKNEFAKWDKEIKRRGRGGGGGGSRGGGWFGSGGSFGWFNSDSFWQTILTVLVIILVYLIVMKRELLLAFIENPLLCLRGARDALTSLMSRTSYREEYRPLSAKERVLRKWGSD